jgi:hypothetical protein
MQMALNIVPTTAKRRIFKNGRNKSIWHEITGVQYDGWQHTEEEDGRRKRRQHGGVFRIQNATDGESDDD